MANPILVGVENPEELLNAGAYAAGALIQIQSSTAETQPGTFADISGTGSTPTIAIVTGTYKYTGYDPSGGSATWYRTRYKNSGGTITSDWSASFQVGAGGYTSLYNVKQDLDKLPSDITADELLLDYISDITDVIRGHCGREFASSSGTWTYDGYAATYGGKCLLIPRGVQSISLLEAAASTGGSFSTISSTSYVLRPSSQERTPGWPATEVWLIESQPPFAPGYDNIRVTGVLGFAVIPPRIEGVARRAVVRAYAARQAGSNDMTGSDSGQAIVSRFVSKQDWAVLDTFAPALVG